VPYPGHRLRPHQPGTDRPGPERHLAR